MSAILTAVQEDDALDEPPLLTGTEALFLDFDGTLTPFAPKPDAVVIDPALPLLLQSISARLGGALALVTGRPLAQIDALLGIRLPGSGVHGLEFRAKGESPIRFLGPNWPMGRMEAALGGIVAADTRLWLETKPGSLALHYRAAPEREAQLRTALSALVLEQPDLTLLRGHCVLEIKPSGFDKGRAMAMLLTLPPWHGRLAVVAGDDVTDEDAFRQARLMKGWGIKVGAGHTSATFRVDSIADLARWMRKSLRNMGS